MKPVSISEAHLDEILDSAFNPPEIDVVFSESDFYGEWKDVQSNLKSSLLELGYVSWNDSGDDYTIADDWGLSRNHDIEIHCESMWADSRILPAVQRVLASLDHAYQVVVHHDLFLRGNTAMCHFIVRIDTVLSQTDDPKMLKRLGFA